MLDTPIKTYGDSVITFRDIAKVKRTFEDRKTYARVNGKNSVTIEVSKRIGEIIIQKYLNKEIDSVEVIYNEFISVASQKIICKSFLPIALIRIKHTSSTLP